MGRMAKEDFRALTPLTHSHVNPYGARFEGLWKSGTPDGGW